MSAERAPVWLLDVDGVVNACSPEPDTQVWPRASWRAVRVRHDDGATWPILAAEPVLDFLRQTHASGRAEIRWHTTWQHSAVRHLAPALDLPDWPVAEAPEFSDRYASGNYAGYREAAKSWWKLRVAERVLLDENRPLVWTDDDIAWERTRSAALSMLLTHRGLHAVSPTTTVGLTARNLRGIGKFLDGFLDGLLDRNADDAR
jgi:hypothetical protein